MIQNPNRKLGIYYDNIETLVFYKDSRFDFQTLETFFQHQKGIDFFSLVFEGQQVVFLSRYQISKFEEEKKDGVYGIDVKIFLTVRFKLGLFKTEKGKPKIRCNLKVPLRTSNATTGASRECHIEKKVVKDGYDTESSKASRQQLKEAICAALFDFNVSVVCTLNQIKNRLATRLMREVAELWRQSEKDNVMA
ncbi:hypothetical protein RYX36_015552 [Vicia faba]